MRSKQKENDCSSIKIDDKTKDEILSKLIIENYELKQVLKDSKRAISLLLDIMSYMKSQVRKRQLETWHEMTTEVERLLENINILTENFDD